MGLDAHALTAGKTGLEPQRSASESAIAQLTATERAVLSRKEVSTARTQTPACCRCHCCARCQRPCACSL